MLYQLSYFPKKENAHIISNRESAIKHFLQIFLAVMSKCKCKKYLRLLLKIIG